MANRPAAAAAAPLAADTGWRDELRARALAGLAGVGRTGYVEVAAEIHPPTSATQTDVFAAMREATIRTFGWPIGMVVETGENRPRPTVDGVILAGRRARDHAQAQAPGAGFALPTRVLRQYQLIVVPPWALPLIVLAVTTPILVAWLTVGPSFGLLMAGLVGQAVVLTAIRLSSQPPRRRSRRRNAQRPPREDPDSNRG